MFDTNKENSTCAFAEQLVSFLYAETEEGRGRDAFQAHLKTCPACADELSAFGSVRASIFDWRASEFSALPTPKIEFPRFFDEQVKNKSVKFAHSSGQTKSWLDRLRAPFAFSPALTAALFFVIACAGMFALAHNFSGSGQIAETGDKNNLQTNVSTTSAQNDLDLAYNADANKEVIQNTNENPVSSGNLKIKEMTTQNSQAAAAQLTYPAAKVSKASARATLSVKPSAPKKAIAPFVDKSHISNSEVAQIKSTTKPSKLPKLNSIEEDDDDEDMLLLADLVDEAGGK
jgi:hypothetical protein